jgi:cytochrome c oxidase subunit IV
MKSEWRFFGFLTAFLFVAAIVYSYWTRGDFGSVEWVGTVALVLSGLLTLMCGGFFLVISRRIDPRPEDRPNAEIVEGVGEVGFFSPGSYYPFGIAAASFVAALGMVFWMPWLIAVGLIGVLVSTGGLLFEYYTGSRRGAEG